MKPIYKYLPLAALAALPLLQACDTTEDLYEPGDYGRLKLTSEGTPATIRLAAGNTPTTIEIQSNLTWAFELRELETTDMFTAKASKTTGNGSIEITPTTNYEGNKPRTGKLYIYATEAPEKNLTYDLRQLALTFQMESQEYPEKPENGGTPYDLTYDSSVNWVFDVKSVVPAGATAEDLLTFEKGKAGEFDSETITNPTTWLPNYSQEPRSITLQLVPQDATLKEDFTNERKLPASFTLTQAAGTLPEVTNLTAKDNSVKDQNLSQGQCVLSYTSKAPIKSCGIEVVGDGKKEKINVPVPEGGYPLEGSFTIDIPYLGEGKTYTVNSILESMVGPAEVKTAEFTTPYITYPIQGLKFGLIDIKEDYTTVSATINYETDLPVTKIGYIIKTKEGAEVGTAMTTQGLIDTSAEAMRSGVVNLAYTGEPLKQNTTYTLTPYADIDNSGTTLSNRVEGSPIEFTTKQRTPGEDDNKPIE